MLKRISVIQILVLFILTWPLGAGAGDVSQSLVRLQAICDEGKTRSGTGFVVALQDGAAFVATAQHVVAGCDEIRATFAARPTAKRGATVHQMEAATDLALLRVENSPAGVDLLPVTERFVKAGSTADLVGFPLGAPKARFSPVTISNLEGSILSFTGEVESGSSGSPIVHEGVAIGMVTRMRGRSKKAVPGAMLMALVFEGWLKDQKQYPCRGTIAGTPGVQLRQVHYIPSPNLPSLKKIEGGTAVSLERRCTAFGKVWYQIDYEGNRLKAAWIPEPFIKPGTSCPSEPEGQECS